MLLLTQLGVRPADRDSYICKRQRSRAFGEPDATVLRALERSS
jgi:hypothetical protein